MAAPLEAFMIFTPTSLAGGYIVDLEPHRDERGMFARTFCAREFAANGLSSTIVQCNVSRNRRRGTVRGLHFQDGDAAETKLVRCTRGAIYDLIVDVRPGSPTYLRHLGLELTAESGRALYIPRGFAHGFQTLTDDAEVSYNVDNYYSPSAERGLRYDDPALAIRWPVPPTEISPRDRAWPLIHANINTAREDGR
jgi:dTDP-4-dehydrorhamnose 3,5-epimerase